MRHWRSKVGENCSSLPALQMGIDKVGIDKVGIDQMGIDEVGIEVGINQERTLSTSYYLRCWLVFKSTEVLVSFQEY